VLAPYVKSGMKWLDIIQAAHNGGQNLSVSGFYCPAENYNNQVFSYYVYAASVSQVEMDVLSGQVDILRSDIVYDCGQSLNPAVDIGQVEGAFIMGVGMMMTEDVVINDKGVLVANGTWDYKPPLALDIPIKFNVTFLDNAWNNSPDAILGSKATGEPPYILSASVLFALKDCIVAARAAAGLSGPVILQTPTTVEMLQRACGVAISQFYMQ